MTSDEVVAALRAAGCVFAEDEAAILIDAASADSLPALVSRRVAGEPLEWIVGWVEFAGQRIKLAPGVFVPRRRTEFLAELAITRTSPGDCVVELCCGAGAIAATIARNVANVELFVSDIDPVAVACARSNLRGSVFVGDLFEGLPPRLHGAVAVIVANAPYVPTHAIASMPTEARDHEPLVALDGGADGLDIAGRIAAEAPAWLRSGGTLLIETSRDQSAELQRRFGAAGFDAESRTDDDLDATVVLGNLL